MEKSYNLLRKTYKQTSIKQTRGTLLMPKGMAAELSFCRKKVVSLYLGRVGGLQGERDPLNRAFWESEGQKKQRGSAGKAGVEEIRVFQSK